MELFCSSFACNLKYGSLVSTLMLSHRFAWSHFCGLPVSGLLEDCFRKLQTSHRACQFVAPYIPPTALETHTPISVDTWSLALTSYSNRV